MSNRRLPDWQFCILFKSPFAGGGGTLCRPTTGHTACYT